MKPLLGIALIGFSTVIGANYASADALTSNPGGWGGYVIDFEVPYLNFNFTPATDIFAGEGATFSSNLLFFQLINTNWGGITGGSLFSDNGFQGQTSTI
jgi:hypothetical protein